MSFWQVEVFRILPMQEILYGENNTCPANGLMKNRF